MAKFPTAIDDASSLFTPADAFQSKPLETTATNGIGAGDSTISVESTSVGFADAYGILSIDDELIVYTAKTVNQFTGCIRGAFETVAAAHQNGSTVRANMVAGFLTALQSGFKITGTLAGGQTGLWIAVRQYAGNGDDWTTGDIHLWGACLQQGDDSRAAYARTWASQMPHLATGPTVIAAPDGTTSPLKIYGPGSDLADTTLLELTANGELILAGGSGNGYRLAELGAANNPSGWSGVLRVKTPGGSTIGYILLYANP
jgi:hypothetical protein